MKAMMEATKNSIRMKDEIIKMMKEQHFKLDKSYKEAAESTL